MLGGGRGKLVLEAYHANLADVIMLVWLLHVSCFDTATLHVCLLPLLDDFSKMNFIILNLNHLIINLHLKIFFVFVSPDFPLVNLLCLINQFIMFYR